MARIDARERAKLPNSAFAYIDSKGNRRLPINDEAHVRNALSRFSQVKFESPEARERTFRRLLRAASDYGIAPVGFVTRQLREARVDTTTDLPSGPVTLMLTDIEGSTRLVQDLGEEYPSLLEDMRNLIRDVVAGAGGYEVDCRADEFFAAFGQASEAIVAAIEIQRTIAARTWPRSREVRVRIGVHSGSPALTDTGYVGLAVHVMARVCTAAHGGQILITTAARDGLVDQSVELTSLGSFQLQGLPEAAELFQVSATGLQSDFPPLRVAHER